MKNLLIAAILAALTCSCMATATALEAVQADLEKVAAGTATQADLDSFAASVTSLKTAYEADKETGENFIESMGNAGAGGVLAAAIAAAYALVNSRRDAKRRIRNEAV